MKIKSLVLDKYGPLTSKSREPISLKNFNLIYGRNESGKTLFLEALVKLMLKKYKELKGIDRVEEAPKGYITIETDNQELHTLPDDGDLTKIINKLTASECCNIFVIQNSDLSIDQEQKFYPEITDHLIGLRTKDLTNIDKMLQELGHLTPSGDLDDTKKSGWLKNRNIEALKLIKAIEQLETKIEEKGFNLLEKKIIEDEDQIDFITLENQELEHAKKREEYEEGIHALGELKQSLTIYKNLENYTEETVEIWSTNETTIKTHLEDILEKQSKLTAEQEELSQLNQRSGTFELDFAKFKDRKKEIDSLIKTDLELYKQKNEKLQDRKIKNSFLNILLLISIPLLLISVIFLLTSLSSLSIVFCTNSAILIIFIFINNYRIVGDKAWLSSAFERININASKFGLNADCIEDIISKIQQFDEEFAQKQAVFEGIKTAKIQLETGIKDKQDDINHKERLKRDSIGIIEKIKREFKLESLQEYINNLALKNNHETNLNTQELILNRLFEKTSDALDENISYWYEKLNSIESYKDKAKDIKFNNEKYMENIKKFEELVRSKEEKKKLLTAFSQDLRDVENKLTEILLDESELTCDTSIDLQLIKQKLQTFIQDNSARKDLVGETKKLFAEIATEEKEKITDLFSTKSAVSQNFKEITKNRYDGVIFNVESGEIEVKRKDGKILDISKLSGGTYDQLYFSIRLAIGEKLLNEQTGFFILDDPFIKADIERTKLMITMLEKIVARGWQILYFSSKFDIYLLLKQEIEKGTIKLINIPDSFSLDLE